MEAEEGWLQNNSANPSRSTYDLVFLIACGILFCHVYAK